MSARSLQRVDDAYRKLGALMRSFVTSKKEELASTTEGTEPLRSDLLTRLVSASESEGKNGLNDTEVVSALQLLPPHWHLMALVDRECIRLLVCWTRCVWLIIGSGRNLDFLKSETTAHTVAAALALLALYEDEQDKAVKAIWEAFPDGRDPVSIRTCCLGRTQRVPSDI